MKPGRPKTLKDGERKKARQVSLSDAEVAALRKLGDGGLSEGIRRALAIAMKHSR